MFGVTKGTQMNRLVIPVLRVALAVLLILAVLIQVTLPGMADQVGQRHEELASLAVPYSVAAILAIVCLQVALVIVWRLLSLVADDAVLTARAVRLVDGITICFGSATALAVAVVVHAYVIARVGGPGEGIALMVAVWGGLALVLLSTVIKHVLTAAIDAPSEPERTASR